jgi:N-acetylglutamate synthase-like GNAT family acetyltransferase
MTLEQIDVSKLIIRPMESRDIGAVLELDRKLAGRKRAVTYTELISANLGGNLDFSYIGEVENKIAGFVLARHDYAGEPAVDIGLIQILGVDPDLWGKNIATRLVAAVLERCRSKGLRTVRVLISERDSRLQAFFAHVGFRRGQLIDYDISL